MSFKAFVTKHLARKVSPGFKPRLALKRSSRSASMGRAVVPIPYHSNANVTAKALVVLGTGPGSASKSPKAWVKMLCVSECDWLSFSKFACWAFKDASSSSFAPIGCFSHFGRANGNFAIPSLALLGGVFPQCGAVAATYCARLAWMAGMPGTTCPDDMSFGRIGCISSRRRRHPFPGRPRRPCYERLNNRKLPEQKQLHIFLAHNWLKN